MKAYDLSRLKFLIVDRNVNMRRIYKQVLRSFGLRDVREASDGEEAVKVMYGFIPDMIVTGWDMAPMGGDAFIRKVRKGEDCPAVPWTPIILVTSHTDARTVAAARDAGVHEVLAKPVSAKGLYSRVVAVLEDTRPFVKCKAYTGPDRHRRSDEGYTGPKRRGADKDSLEDAFEV